MRYVNIDENGDTYPRQKSWRYPRNDFEREVLAACRSSKWPSRQIRNSWLDIEARMKRDSQYAEYVNEMVEVARQKNADKLTITLNLLARVCLEKALEPQGKQVAKLLKASQLAYSTEND